MHQTAPRSHWSRVRLCFVGLALAMACGDDPLLTSEGTGRTGPLDASVDAAAIDGGMDAQVRVTPTVDASATRRDASMGDGAVVLPEVCDGLDNDLNGIVDDLDVGRDGICDCLRIATLGAPGTSGQGNVFQGWLGSRGSNPVFSIGDMVLTPQVLAPFQIIVAQDLRAVGRTYAKSEVDALEAWVRAGGGLMTLIGFGDMTERTNANEILARFGTSYGPEYILQKVGSNSLAITTWLGPHPVIEGITAVGVDNGYPVVGTGTTLAQGGGYDVLKVQEIEKGHLIVWGDEWITYDSEWTQRPDYQVAQFWVNSIKWLTVARVCQVPPVYL